MIFLLFLGSLVTIEAILHYDEARKRKMKPQAPGIPVCEASANPTPDSILALMNGVEQHGRGATPAVQTEVAVSKTPSVNSLVVRD
jgi:hypothetical protein